MMNNVAISRSAVSATATTTPHGVNNTAGSYPAVATSTADYWYDETDMFLLLNQRVREENLANVVVLHPLHLGLNTQLYNFETEIAGIITRYRKNTTTGTLLLPLSLSNVHWVGLLIQLTEDAINITYTDSLPYSGSNIMDEVRAIMVQHFPTANISVVPFDERAELNQIDYSSCGPFTIENLIQLVKKPKEIAIAIASPSSSSNLTIDIRRHHIALSDQFHLGLDLGRHNINDESNINNFPTLTTSPLDDGYFTSLEKELKSKLKEKNLPSKSKDAVITQAKIIITTMLDSSKKDWKEEELQKFVITEDFDYLDRDQVMQKFENMAKEFYRQEKEPSNLSFKNFMDDLRYYIWEKNFKIDELIKLLKNIEESDSNIISLARATGNYIMHVIPLWLLKSAELKISHYAIDADYPKEKERLAYVSANNNIVLHYPGTTQKAEQNAKNVYIIPSYLPYFEDESSLPYSEINNILYRAMSYTLERKLLAGKTVLFNDNGGYRYNYALDMLYNHLAAKYSGVVLLQNRVLSDNRRHIMSILKDRQLEYLIKIPGLVSDAEYEKFKKSSSKEGTSFTSNRADKENTFGEYVAEYLNSIVPVSSLLLHLNEKNIRRKYVQLFDKFQEIKKFYPVVPGETSFYDCYPEDVKKILTSMYTCEDQDAFINICKDSYLVSPISLLISQLRKRGHADQRFSELFALVAATEELRDLADRAPVVVEQFAFLEELAQDSADIIGIAIGRTAKKIHQIIPPWAIILNTQIRNTQTISLHAIDPSEKYSPELEVTAARSLGLIPDQQKKSFTNKDNKIKLQLHNTEIPLESFSKSMLITEAFFQKFKKILLAKLDQGHTIVLGIHTAGNDLELLPARIYNELIIERPTNHRLFLYAQGGNAEWVYYKSPQKVDLWMHQKCLSNRRSLNHSPYAFFDRVKIDRTICDVDIDEIHNQIPSLISAKEENYLSIPSGAVIVNELLESSEAEKLVKLFENIVNPVATNILPQPEPASTNSSSRQVLPVTQKLELEKQEDKTSVTISSLRI